MQSPVQLLHTVYGDRSGMKSHLTGLPFRFLPLQRTSHHRNFLSPVSLYLLLHSFSTFTSDHDSGKYSSTLILSLPAFAPGKIFRTSSIYSSGLVRDGL